jgi:hypothetical protein
MVSRVPSMDIEILLSTSVDVHSVATTIEERPGQGGG